MKPSKKFFKLDGRHTGFRHFAYYIPLKYTIDINDQIFYLYRNWCWETWGPSKELVYWLEDIRHPMILPVSHNAHWAWQNDEYATRLYLRTEKELSIFLLKWGDQL